MTALSGFRPLTAIVLAGAIVGNPLSAAPLYTVAFSNYNESSVSSATPFGRDSAFALPPSNGYGLATGQGYARQGRVGATHQMDLTWNGGSGAYSSGTHAICKTDDLIITGPANPTTVAATLNMRLQSEHSRLGGYSGHGGHGSQVKVALYARQAFYPFGSYAQVYGDFQYTNAGPFSSGVLAGQTGPSLDVPISLSTNFPVNVPFAVEFRLEARGTAYGNFATNPGMTECAAGGNSSGLLGPGLRLDQVNNQVMTLPNGYTLNSNSWGIVNNGLPVLAVDDAPVPARLGLRVAGDNPSTGVTRVMLELPRNSVARVAVLDVAGRVVRTLADDRLAAGRHSIAWDGRAADGTDVPAGLYYLRGEGDGEWATVRIVRLR